jgi:light-regulated signal transduction histidine kinase (bacteriophytochrome)
MIAVVRDISAQVQAEEELANAQHELEHRAGQLSRIEAELSDYARAVSHDLSEPLRTVSSYVQLLEQRYHDQLDEDATEFIGFTVDAVKRMRLLLADLLALATIGASGRAFSEVDTAKVVDEVTHDLATGIAEAGAVVKVGNLPIVTANRREIGMLFQNLIGNALKFRSAERSPAVNVSAVAEDGATRFAVADNGVGIDPVHQERVFGVFRRLHPPGEYPGTGIGLAICKKVIDRHGGRIWVESHRDEGSTFYFTIPDP